MLEKKGKIDEIDEYSEQLREVLVKIPNWFFRWGTILILFTIAIVFFFSWFIKYPDIVVSEITITTQNQPIDIICKSEGVLGRIFVSESQKVKRNDIIAYIVNESNYEDVLTLINFLKKYSSVADQMKNFPENLRLGPLQESYNEFLTYYSKYWLNKTNEPIQKEIKGLKTENENNKILIKQLIEKRKLFQKELLLNEKGLVRDSMLHLEGVISDKDLEIKQIEHIRKKREFQDILNQISNVYTSTAKIQREITTLSNTKIEVDYSNRQNVLLKLEQLKGKIEGWKKDYLFISPIKGTVSFNSFFEKNTFLKKGENVFTIVPEKAGKFEGQAEMPITRSGKVRIGQQVNIKLNNFPYEEYGMIIGKVSNISLTPSNDRYIVKVNLENGLNTTYGKKLKFNQKMKGTAEIVTEDLRLIQRIFYQFRKLFIK